MSNLHNNTVRKVERSRKARVIKFNKAREVRYQRFKSRVTMFSFAFLTISSMIGGSLYFLMGQVKLNILNDKLVKSTKELNSYNNDLPLLSREEQGRSSERSVELNDKAEVF